MNPLFQIIYTRFPMSITMLFGGAALLLALIGYRDPNESNEDDKSGDTGDLNKSSPFFQKYEGF